MGGDGVDAGILVVDKATGPTSHDVVAGVRRALDTRRVGHCGTLDPLATGVLVVCVGRYTRLADWISRGGKEYEATFRLGAESDTDDAQGQLGAEHAGPLPGRAEIDAALPALTGELEQVPPAHSAVKVDGVRSYRRARRQEVVELQPRRVRVDAFEVVDYAAPDLRVRIACGKGTYVRSLARDLGRALGCGAHVTQLRRTRVGSLGLADAVRLDEEPDLAGRFVEPRRALYGILDPVEIDEEALRGFAHGNPVIPVEAPAGECAVYGGGAFWGVGRVDAEGALKPLRVLGAAVPVA